MSALETSIVADLWDLEDWGFDTALDRVQHDLGAGGVTIRIDPPAGVQLRARALDVPRLYRHTGGLWFRPEQARYEQTRLKPICAPEMRARNPYAKLAEHCGRRDVPLRAWVEGCRNVPAVSRHPEMAVKDVFGHPSAEWLCPHNPDVSAYLHALLADVCSSHALDGVVLASPAYQPIAETLRDVQAGTRLGDADRFLLNLCFCESSRQQAANDDVEVQAVARLVETLLKRRLEEEQPERTNLDELLALHPELERFHRWRRDQAIRLIESLVHQVDTTVILHERVGPVGRAKSAVADAAHRSARPATIPADARVLVLCDKPDASGIDGCIQRGTERVGTASNVELLFDLRPGLIDSSQTLVAACSRAAESGVNKMSFGNLSLWPESRIDWIRKASRNARRILESA